MKKFFSLIFAVMLVLAIVPVLPLAKTRAAGLEEETQKFELVPYNFNKDPEQTENIYGISRSNISPFTPFDYQSETYSRMPGSSFSLQQDEFRRIEATVTTDNEFELVYGKEYSLFMWVYFDAFVVHGLALRLNFDNGSYLIWELGSDQLLATVKKYAGEDLSENPHAWNLLEFPFSVSREDGEVKNGENYQKVSSVSIKYTSSVNEQLQIEYSGLKFYDLYIRENKGRETIAAKEKQDYIIYGFNNFDERFYDGLFVGDGLTIPTFASVVNYAWMGEIDLKRGGNFASGDTSSNYVWRVMLSEPNKSTSKRLYAGDKVSFSEEGIYLISYQCLNSSQDRIISYSQQFNISVLNPIYFSVNNVEGKVGQKYTIDVYASSAFDEMSDFTFSTDSEGITLNYLGDGRLEIALDKAGKYTITASIEANRKLNSQTKKYSVDFEVKVNKGESDHKVLKICLWCALGGFGIVLVVFVIKMLAEARRFDVK